VPWRLSANELVLDVPSKLGAGALIYYQGVSEPETTELFKKLLRAGDVVFDVGAHVGEYTLLAAKLVDSRGAVHAFEPNPDLHRAIVHNVELNRFKNCSVNQLATGDQPGTMFLDLAGDPSEAHLRVEGGSAHASRSFSVAVATLDDYWSAIGRPQVRLIKMDIEGAELLALKGASRLLESEHAPVVLCEAMESTTTRFGYSFSDIDRFLASKGYEVFDLVEFISADAKRLSDYPPSGNLLAFKGPAARALGPV